LRGAKPCQCEVAKAGAHGFSYVVCARKHRNGDRDACGCGEVRSPVVL